MKLNEKIFEFCINFELLYFFNLCYIPNQVEEKIWGFDSKFYKKTGASVLSIGMSDKAKIVLLQYKIPEPVDTSNLTSTTKEFKRLKNWGNDILRFKIHKNKKGLDKFSQHNNLKGAINTRGIKAYYCSPRFFLLNELMFLHRKRRVLRESAFFDLHHLRKLEPATSHNLYYNYFGNLHALFSEEQLFEQYDTSFKTIEKFLQDDEYTTIGDFIEQYEKSLEISKVTDNNVTKRLINISFEFKKKFNFDLLIHFDFSN